MQHLLSWLPRRERSPEEDRLWDHFLNRPPTDPRNVVTGTIQNAPSGRPFVVKTEVHDSAAMSGHLRELARFVGAEGTGIIRVDQPPLGDALSEALPGAVGDADPYPFAVVCTVSSKYDPRAVHGIGGQLVVQRAAIVSFTLAAYIRELGYRAVTGASCPPAWARAAGLGELTDDGRLVTRQPGSHLYVASPVLTDIPLGEQPVR